MSMNRVLSFPQSNRCDDGAEEFVSKRFCFSCLCSVAFASLVFGYLLGRRSPSSAPVNAVQSRFVRCKPLISPIAPDLWKYIRVENMMDQYKNITDFNEENEPYNEAKAVYEFFQKHGLDHIAPLTKQVIFMSLKDPASPDILRVMKSENAQNVTESIYEAEQKSRYIIPKHVVSKQPAVSVVKGIPVYVNYGRYEDFQYIEENGVFVKNRIAVIRFGKIPLHDKVQIAFTKGAVGIILYADPQEYPNFNTSLLPEEILPVVLGQLQKFYVNTDQATNSSHTQSIPVQLVPATTATSLLKKFSLNTVAPKQWVGGLNITYYIGPGFNDPQMYISMRTSVVNVYYECWDVIGSISGFEEKDRFVIIGSNRQPTRASQRGLKGTWTVMGIIKLLSELKRNVEWKPRRTLLFLNWGLEGVEHFMPSQWFSENKKTLKEKAVMYVHIDDLIRGTYHLRVKASPPLYDLIMDVAISIQNRNIEELSSSQDLKTVVDTWSHDVADDYKNKSKFHPINDYWMSTFGVPAVNVYCDDKNQEGLAAHEDPSNTTNAEIYQKTIQYFLVSVIYRFVESALLPYKMEYYSYVFNESLANILEVYNSQLLNISEFYLLQNALTDVVNRLNAVTDQLDTKKTITELELRVTNDQRMRINELLFCTEPTYSRPLLLSSDGLSGVAFGALQDALVDSLLSSSGVLISALVNTTTCLNHVAQEIELNVV